MISGTQEMKFSGLAQELKPGQLVTNPVELITYEIDAANDRGIPDGVVFPESVKDVLKIVRWANENNFPLISRGAGTGLSGGAVAEKGGLILSFSRMNRILELDQVGRSVQVQPGVVNQVLDEKVRQVGLYYPPDPASGRTATIGGNVAENAGGPHCFKYGVTTNYVTGMQVVLADGNKVQLGGRALDIPEYNFTSLFNGSEGSLGVITRLDLRLLRYPPAVKTMMAYFETVHAAGEAVSAIIARGLVPAAMEFMDQKIMRIIEDYAHAGLLVEAGAALIIEVDGFASSLDSQMDEIVHTLRQKQVVEIHLAQTEDEREKIWFGRNSAAGAMARLSPAYYLLDGTVPRSRLADTLVKVTRVCEAFELGVAYVFHAGDGNLHPFILIEDPNDENLLERVRTAGEQIMHICVEQNGSITGEHGVGIEKRPFLSLMYNTDELGAMLDVKRVFDENNLMNPGKIFPQVTLKGEAPLHSAPANSYSEQLPSYYEPKDLLQGQEYLQDCRAKGHKIHLMGGNTKAQKLTSNACSLRTTSLSGIRDLSLADLYVTVGAGITLDALNAELKDHKVWVPLLSPWQQSTLGGILSTNFNAPLRMRFGSIRDQLLALKVILPDGRILRLGRPVVKNVAGYDLAKLFIGAYGTLGLLGEATLKISPRPRLTSTLIVSIEELEIALSAGLQLLGVCLNSSSVLLCSGELLGMDAAYALLYTVEGHSQDVETELEQVEERLRSLGLEMIERRQNLNGSQIWADWMRTVLPYKKPAPQPVMRSGLPVKNIAQLFSQITSFLQGNSFLLDIANGLLYTQGILEMENWCELVASLDGYALILNAPIPFLEQHTPRGNQPQSLTLMQSLKHTWDPQGLLNPSAFLV